MTNVSKWLEPTDMDYSYTLDGQTVSEEEAKDLGVGTFSTRSTSSKF